MRKKVSKYSDFKTISELVTTDKKAAKLADEVLRIILKGQEKACRKLARLEGKQ